MKNRFGELNRQVGRARVALSLLAMLSMYVDPSAGGLFHLDKWLLITLVCHLNYSVLAYLALNRDIESRSARQISTGLDLLFAAAVAFLTEGRTSPSFVFFVFAIVAVGFRTGFRDTLLVTLYSVALYLLLVALSDGFASIYVMRATYLAIAGYLIGFFGQQRVKFEARLRELEAETERQNIARALHDGYIQALAGFSLRLESCRDMLVNNQPAEALAEIKEIQIGVNREYDEVRRYVRLLAKAEPQGQTDPFATSDTTFQVAAAFAARGIVAEHILQIMLEGIRNTERHGQARSASISVNQAQAAIRIKIDDDGVGFEGATAPPWTIASRIAEFGGRLTVRSDVPVGAHLEMEIPVT